MKQQSAKDLQLELDAADKRINELTEMRKEAADNFQKAQDAFVGAKISLDELQTEQSKLQLLDNTIESLESKRSELQTALDAATEKETRADTLSALKTIAGEAETAFNEYVSNRSELDKAIALHGEKTFDALMAFRGKQKEFLSTFRKLVPGIIFIERPEIKQREPVAKVAAELEEIGLGKDSFKLAIKDDLQTPPLKHPEIVSLTATNFSNQRKNEQRRQKQEANRPKA